MTPKVKKLYKSGLKNEKFLSAILEADGDKKPNIFTRDLEKHLFASTYYGWMVCEHGVAWELHL